MLSFILQWRGNFNSFGNAKMAILSKNQLKTHEIQVGGCSLKLKSDHDPADLEEILQVVEKQTAQAKSKGLLSVQKTLALSCLNIAEELVLLKKTARQNLDQLESAAQSVFSELKSSSPQM